MPGIDLASVPIGHESTYPAPFNSPCNGQSYQRLARDSGLTLFGVNLTVIEPGTWSRQRHWHSHEDELVWVMEGELTLVTTPARRSCAPATARRSSEGKPTVTT